MAKQDGILPLIGAVDNLVFQKTADGYRARKKSTNPRTIGNRAREVMQEFGHAGSAGKVIRQAFVQVINNKGDSRLVSRLVQKLAEVIKTDTSHERGMRTIVDGNLSLLKGFEFNARAVLDTVFYPESSLNIDRANGTVTIGFAKFIPKSAISAPRLTTHFKLTLAAAELDFLAKTSMTSTQSTSFLEWNDDELPSSSLQVSLTDGTNKVIMVTLSIEFFVLDVGKYKPVEDKGYNAMRLIEASGS